MKLRNCFSCFTFAALFGFPSTVFGAPPNHAEMGKGQQVVSEIRSEVSPPKLPTGSETALAVRVSLSAVDVPLTDILQTLTTSSGVALQTPSYVGTQRMTICVKDKPLYEVAGRIVETLSHQVNGDTFYFWEAANQDGRKGFILRPTASATREYRSNLLLPRQEAIQILKDYRAIAQLSPNERLGYKSSLSPLFYQNVDSNLQAQALKALTDAQFASLLKAGHTSLNADKIKSVLSADYALAQTRPYFNYSYVKVPDGPYQPPVSRIQLRLSSVNEPGVQTDDLLIDDPVLSEIYTFQMIGIFQPSYSSYLNGYRQEQRKSGLLPDTGVEQTIYDLTRPMNKANLQQSNDLGYVLNALSQVTGASVYEEHFLRTAYFGFGQMGANAPTITPLLLKGTLPQIVNSICRRWQFQVSQTATGDIVFWSRRWSRDKQADINEKTLEPWRRKLEEKGHFTENDYMDMVQKLSYAQIRITLPYAFNFGDEETIQSFLQTWNRRAYLMRRVNASLSPAEREAALSPEGVVLAEVAARQNILNELRFRSDKQIAAERAGDYSFPPSSAKQILQSRIFLSKPKLEGFTHPEWITERVGGLPYDPLSLTIKNEFGLRWE